VSAEGPGKRIVMVAAGDHHTVALSEAGHVFTWGNGEDGRLGHGDEESQRAPRQVQAGRFGGEKVVFVAAGRCHTVAVTAGGRLYTWGSNERNQLGHGDIGDRWVPTLVGAGAFGGSAVVMAACGKAHMLVVTEDGALWACGCGDYGRLGLNDEANRRRFERVGAVAFGGARVVAAAAGENHSAVVTEDGALWTSGLGHYGRLGHGDEERRLVPTRVAAASLKDTRIGRCRPLPTDHAVALAMGTHGRLGANSPVRVLGGEVSLLAMIAGFSGAWVAGVAGRSEGLVRLLGGVTANPAHRYQLETVG
jgi:alpha-tubulin suppressor-like RCC1 family protein